MRKPIFGNSDRKTLTGMFISRLAGAMKFHIKKLDALFYLSNEQQSY